MQRAEREPFTAHAHSRADWGAGGGPIEENLTHVRTYVDAHIYDKYAYTVSFFRQRTRIIHLTLIYPYGTLPLQLVRRAERQFIAALRKLERAKVRDEAAIAQGGGVIAWVDAVGSDDETSARSAKGKAAKSQTRPVRNTAAAKKEARGQDNGVGSELQHAKKAPKPKKRKDEPSLAAEGEQLVGVAGEVLTLAAEGERLVGVAGEELHSLDPATTLTDISSSTLEPTLAVGPGYSVRETAGRGQFTHTPAPVTTATTTRGLAVDGSAQFTMATMAIAERRRRRASHPPLLRVHPDANFTLARDVHEWTNAILNGGNDGSSSAGKDSSTNPRQAQIYVQGGDRRNSREGSGASHKVLAQQQQQQHQKQKHGQHITPPGKDRAATPTTHSATAAPVNNKRETTGVARSSRPARAEGDDRRGRRASEGERRPQGLSVRLADVLTSKVVEERAQRARERLEREEKERIAAYG